MSSRTLNGEFTIAVVGVTFCPAYPENLYALNDVMSEEGQRDERPTVVLRRNPDNPYDANAVEVHVPALGGDNSMVGHLPRDLAARLAPELDAGAIWQGWVTFVLISPENEERPGLRVFLKRIAQ